MKVAAGVLTFNALVFKRHDLLKQTVESMAAAFEDVTLFDNGNDAASSEAAQALASATPRVQYMKSSGKDTTPGARGELVEHLLRRADVAVASDDDMLWHADAQTKVAKFWAAAPPSMVALSCLLEPAYGHAGITGASIVNGVRVLHRKSVPGAAWSTSRSAWKQIAPYPAGWHSDVKMANKVNGKRLTMAATICATHMGMEKSTHNNVWTGFKDVNMDSYFKGPAARLVNKYGKDV